jgi:sulfite oxidase
VKWLSEISAQAEPSSNFFQARSYKLFPPHVRAGDADWTAGLMLGALPVNAVICSPADGETIAGGEVVVQGYALAGDRRSVERVDLSTDGGEVWITARLIGEAHPGAWRLWEAAVTLPAGAASLVVRAWDSAAQTQPEDVRKIWNFKGYMNNAWHVVRIQVHR